MRYLALALPLLVATPAFAGDRIRTPPMLRGDVQLTYGGTVGWGRLVDRTSSGGVRTEVARWTRQRHGITLSGAFAPYHGIAVTLDLLPIVVHDRVKWGAANDTRIDPDAGIPTLVGGSELPQDVLDASPSSRNHVGFGDMRIGATAIAFAQEGVPGRVAPANLAFDLAVRLPTGGNHDRVRDNGTAGPGLGSAGLELGLTASRAMQGIEPYLRLAYHLNGAYRQVLVDSDGVPTTPPVDPDDPTPDPEGRWILNRAERVLFGLGVDLLIARNVEKDTEFGLDVGAFLSYVGPDEVSVGRWLPAPLDSTIGHRAVTGEHVTVDLGLGLRIRPIQLIEVRVNLGGGWQSPHTLERIGEKTYAVETAPDTFAVQWGVAVRARIR